MNILTSDEIERIGPIDVPLAALWADVELLARRTWGHSAAERDLAWHHLLLAVANYKSQAPVFMGLPPTGAQPTLGEGEDSVEVQVNGHALTVGVDSQRSWRDLHAGIQGLGIARTTTVLSALWPGRHVIIDWRALSAALALAGARLGWDQSLVSPTSTAPADVSWESYAWYRDAVVECADQVGKRPLEVERALWQVAEEAPGITWAQYAERLEHRIDGWRRDGGRPNR